MRYKRFMTEDPLLKRLALLSAAARGAALLAFLLPWLHVDVGRREVVRASGLDLALGDIAVRLPILGTVERDGPPALPLIVAGILIAGALALFLLANPRRRAKTGLVLSALAMCVIFGFVGYAIYVHLPLPQEQMSLIERLSDTIVRQAVESRPGLGALVTPFALALGMKFDWNTLRETGASASK
jgi:hypothetical protein